MRKVRFLLLSLLTITLMTFAMGCEQAGASCESDSDCTDEKEACYAGYCGQNEPAGMINLKFNLRDKTADTSIHCKEANVDNVDVVVSAHGFEVSKTTVACKDVNVHELGANDMGAPVLHLWDGKDYDVKVKFDIKNNSNDLTKSFVAIPQIGGVSVPGEANDANRVELERVQEAILTVKWDIDDGFGGKITECGEINSFRVALNGLEACDEENVCDFSDYVKIPCSNDWQTTFTVREANVGMSLNIYAVKLDDNGAKVLYQHLDPNFKVSDAQLESGAFDRTFTLTALGNKK